MNRAQLFQLAMTQARQASSQGAVEAAVFQAGVAAGLAEELGNECGRAEAHSILVMHLFALGRFAAALQHGHLALQAWQTLRAYDRVCETKLRLAMSLSELGIHLRALQLARGALMLAREHELHSVSRQAIAMLGSLYARAGATKDGEQLLLQALSRARESYDVSTTTTVLNALLALLLGEADEARLRHDNAWLAGLAQRLRRHAGPALAHCSEEPHLFRRTVLRGNVAAALAECGQLEDAMGLQRACAQLAADEGFRVVEMRSRARLANLLLGQGDAASAAAEADRIQALLDREAHAGAELELIHLRARLAATKGESESALALQKQLQTMREAHSQRQSILSSQVEIEARSVLEMLAPGA